MVAIFFKIYILLWIFIALKKEKQAKEKILLKDSFE